MFQPSKLHFLGTTGYHPNNHRQTACLMLPEAGIILDAGTGLFRSRDLICTEEIDIFLSHVHLDHVIGLTFLYDVLHNKNLRRVTVHVATEKIQAIRQHLYAFDLFPVEPNFEIRPLEVAQPIKHPSGVELLAFPVDHPGGCYALRINGLADGRSMAYVTDTTADVNAEYVRKIAGVDTLVHECYFADGWEEKAKLTGHSCLTPVAEVARAAQVGVCYLVHFNPLDDRTLPVDVTAVSHIFANIKVAADQQIIDL